MRVRGKIYKYFFLLVGSVVIHQNSYALEPTLDQISSRPPIHIRRPLQPLITPFTPSGLSPSQVRSAYNLPTTGGSGTIAIIDAYDDPSCQSDFNIFCNQYGLPTATASNFEIHKMSATIAGNVNWAGEISLDVQWAHAIAPNAKILLVEAKSNSNANLLAAVDYATSRADVVAVSMSWGGPETSTESTNDFHFNSVSGANFFASSGDNGTGVEWPAAAPNVTGVGGTELVFSGNVVTMETAWNGSGGGLSAYETEPSYQTNYGVNSTFGRRAVPDVSYNGGPDSAVAVYDSYGEPGWLEVWGTSAGSPQWAAIRCLGGTIVNNTTFYTLASTISTYTTTFRDITIGDNLTTGAAPGFYTKATANYDYVTGLGSPLNYTFTISGSLSASFNVTLLNSYGPLTVNFTDTSVGLTGSSTTWTWTFGDGSTSSSQNPQHIYQAVSEPTTYTVFEIVSTSLSVSTASTVITVTEAGPSASFTKSILNTYGPLTVNFTDTSNSLNGNSTTWYWIFGDGNTDNSQNPQHVYLSVPTTTQYTVKLIVTTPFATNTSATQIVTVTEAGPIASFNKSIVNTYGPLTVNFTDTSSPLNGSSTTWLWTFGDGSTGNSQNPQHVYLSVPTTTQYTVKLIVTTPFGTSTSSTQTITVTESGPIASFSKSIVNTYGPLTVNFTDTSSPLNGNSTTWSWTFGDGGISNSQNPQHVYLSVPTTTQYTILLIVTTPYGTSTSTTQTVTVTESGPTASFSKSLVNTYGPLTVNFTDTSSPLNGNSTTWSWSFGDGSTSNSQNPQHVYLSVPTTTQYTVQLIVTTPYGTSTSSTQTITVTESGPTASFSKILVNTYGPLTVNFTDTSSPLNGNSTTWSWSFGDGSTGNSQNPQHIYLSVPTISQYTVQLIVITPFGTNTSATQIVTVTEPAPSASFSKSIVNTYGPLTVNFTDTSSPLNGNSTTWSWSFGDGSTSNSQNPQHVYLSVPTTMQYTIQLIVTTPFGTSTSVTQTISVTESAPTASFSKSIVNTYGPLTVNFTDTSSPLNGNSTTWSWFFGDGSTSNSQNPQHIYLSVPTTTQYTIQLIVTTPFGTSTSATQIVTVTETGPTASFSKSLVNTYGPLTVNFTDTSSLLNGNSTTWSWSFGDGSTSNSQNPQHVYLSVPTTTQDTVKLIVTTPFGTNTSASQTVTVTESGPTASFSKTIINSYGPLTVNFTDTSSPLNGNSTTWSWSFGDGSTSSSQNPQHVYLSVPTTTQYTIQLIVTTPFGTSTSVSQIITVTEAGPTASFSKSIVNTYGPLTVNFTDTSSPLNGNSTTWSWSFGDGSTSSSQNPQHIYLSVPTTTQYTIQLIVTTPFGTSTSTPQIIIVTETGPTASFSKSIVNTYGPLTVNFTDTSSPLNGNSTTWSWTFGDGSTSSSQNPQHVYLSVLTTTQYSIQLIVTTPFGTSTSVTQTVTITESGPIASFSKSIVNTYGPLTVNFIDTSSPLNGNSTTWSWTFGDGSTSSSQNPQHVYLSVPTITQYTVQLIVTTPFGTSTSATQIITVTEAGPGASFSKSIVNTYGPLTVNFTDTSSPLNGNSTTWSWTFGDGSTSSSQNPQHVYLSVPTTTQYSVKLIVTTPFGTSTSATQTVTVTESGPTASFGKSIVNTYGPLTVNFTDTSNSLNGNSTTWLWTFGDGSISNSQNPQHIYLSVPTSAHYTVQLIVTTPFGVSSSATQIVTVTEVGPIAAFSSSTTSGYGAFTVNFTDQSNNLNGNSTTWNWFFGDGGLSSVQNPSHTYATVAAPTSYTAQLVVTTPFGTSTATQNIFVTEPTPSIPSLISPVGSLTTNIHQQLFSWSTSTDAFSSSIQYNLQVGLDTGFVSKVTTINGISTTNQIVSGLPNGVIYWHILATSAFGTTGSVTRQILLFDTTDQRVVASSETVTFYVGDTTGVYLPVQIFFSSTNTDTVTVTNIDTTAPNLPTSHYISRYWIINRLGTVSNLTAVITFSYTSSDYLDSGVGLESELVPAWDTTGSGGWSSITSGITVDTINHLLTVSGITHFSNWTLGGDNGSVPIELSSFEAIKE